MTKVNLIFNFFPPPIKYGFVNFALEELVLRNFGEETWNKIK